MKTNKWITGMAICAGIGLAACTSMDEGLSGPAETGEGQLMISLTSGTNFTEETRALNEASFANTANYTVQVLDKENNEKLNCKGSEITSKMPITLPIGECTVKAYYGSEEAASRDNFYVYGEWTGTIKSEQKENIALTCTPTCGKVTVNFDQSMAIYYSDYSIKFSGTKALGGKSIDWAKNDTEPWYVLLDKDGENISFSITAITKEGYVNSSNMEQIYTKTGTFPLQRNKAYKMNVKSVYTPSEEDGETGMNIEITIDESTNDKEHDIEVPVTWI